MDLSELRAGVLTRMGHPAGDALFPDATLTQLVNAALQYLSAEHDWAWLESVEVLATANADGEYPVPAGYVRTISLHSPDGFELKRADLQDVEFLRAASGEPKMFAVVGADVVLAPTPNGVQNLRHRVITTEPDLVDAADEPLLPARWHQAVVEYAANLGYRREGNLQDAGSALAAYETWVEQMRKVASRYSPSKGGGEPVTPPDEEGKRG